MITLIIAYIAVGLLSGILSGLIGLGGGIVIVPALVALFTWQGFSDDVLMHLATSTSLAVVMLTTAMATWFQHKRNAVAWNYLQYLIPAMVVGAVMGVYLGKHLSSHVLRYVFAIFCFVLAVRLLFAKDQSVHSQPQVFSKGILMIVGLLAGALAGLLGIGGGAIVIPILMWLGLSMPMVSGTSAASAFPTAVTGSIASMAVGLHYPGLPAYCTGFIYWPAVVLLGGASILAAPVGVALAHRLPEKIVKRIFAVVLMLIAWQMCR